MKRLIILVALTGLFFGFSGGEKETQRVNPPIYIAFLWHMHQPIYFPYESVVQTDQNGRYPFSVTDIHNQRTGPYTSWPKNAVQKGISAGLPNFGAQVSFSGSLIENLNALETNGNGNFSNWKSHWNSIKNQTTSRGNPRLDMVGFGYFHPLMGLIDSLDIRKQVQYHKNILAANFPGAYSKGIFPPENAFSPRMIPALVGEGLEWILVDNIHFDRAAAGYPFTTGGNIYEPNKADQLNPNPNDWVQLNGLWAPTRNSAKWGRQPHWVEYVDPHSGAKSKIIAIPADRYMGNEDGRGGFGALNYEAVMSQLESYNTDPNHPVLIVLHHDGDNYGGGSEGYYGGNFQAFVNWVQSNPNRFVCTTIQDYLQMFPPAASDVIHVEDGSWSGADNGDPEFKKWLGDPDGQGYSPDRNSWGVLTAAKNLVHTANQIDPANPNTLQAWKYLLVGESSDYWYWDGSLNGIWDSHPTRAANQAILAAQSVTGTDVTPPTIFVPQREPYNPGATEWGIQQTNVMQVWTYVYDKSGLNSVKLRYRIDNDGTNSMASTDNETYTGGPEVGTWTDISMAGIDKPSNTNPAPLLKAKEFSANLPAMTDKLIDYYVEATDINGNIARSAIKHVWIGSNTGGGGTGGSQLVTWTPAAVTKNDTIVVTVKNAPANGKLHWGVNNNGSNWQTPDSLYWPAGTVKFNGSGPAVESPFSPRDTAGTMVIKIGPFNNPRQSVDRIAFVIHYDNNTWNNNNGSDFSITFGGGSGGSAFVMDGQFDQNSFTASSSGAVKLNLGWNGSELYVATQAAPSQGKDVFVFVTDSLRAMRSAPWAKGGQVTGWGAYLANESTNNYAGWFDQSGTANKASGTVLEGSLNIQGEFGFVPSKLYIAVAHYGTNDAGTLQAQVPAGNGNGDLEASEFFMFDYIIPPPTGVAGTESIISTYALSQNYPNPFNPVTTITYQVPSAGKISLKVFDMLGNEVAVLAEGEQSQGMYSVIFDGSKLTSGVYFYTLQAGGYKETKKLVLMK